MALNYFRDSTVYFYLIRNYFSQYKFHLGLWIMIHILCLGVTGLSSRFVSMSVCTWDQSDHSEAIRKGGGEICRFRASDPC